jgi:hypothetical protein
MGDQIRRFELYTRGRYTLQTRVEIDGVSDAVKRNEEVGCSVLNLSSIPILYMAKFPGIITRAEIQGCLLSRRISSRRIRPVMSLRMELG